MTSLNSTRSITPADLAVNNGPKTRTTPWPARHLFGQAEKEAAMRLFDQAIESGNAFGYNGPEEEAYCKAFADWLGGGYADAVNSGTCAVYAALRSLDLPAFSEVIVPAISDAGGVMPVALLNLVPVPADTGKDTLNITAETIARRITPRTRAIVVAHIAGHPCDMDPIIELAKKHNLRIVEDCAQAHGARYKGRYVGTLGDVGAFSTMSGKHHATAAQGGVVFTRDETLHRRGRQAADRGKPFGEPGAAANVLAALNLNGNELACAVGRVQLGRLPEIVRRRQAFARQVIDGARHLKSVTFIDAPSHSESVYWFLVAKFNASQVTVDKATFTSALAAEGIPAGPSYFHCPIDWPWYQNRNVFPGGLGYPWAHDPQNSRAFTTADLPNALQTRETLFPIQMHENCGEQEARDILAAIAKVEAAFGV